jgi:uncharacterized protein (TIGR02145 family)
MIKSEFGTMTDRRDGRTYKTVKIGDQIWMAENLAYMPTIYAGKKEGGLWVYNYYGHKGLLGTSTDIDEAAKSRFYNKFGCLYDYDTALISCPGGWHLPSHEEWMILEMNLGMDESTAESYDGFRGSNEGKKLKSGDLWKPEGSDEFGFNVLPAGYHGYDKGVFSKADFREVGVSTHFWTSSDTYVRDAVYRSLRSGNDKIAAATTMKHNGLSVRAIMD